MKWTLWCSLSPVVFIGCNIACELELCRSCTRFCDSMLCYAHQFQVFQCFWTALLQCLHVSKMSVPILIWASSITVAILAQGTSWAVAAMQAFLTAVRFPRCAPEILNFEIFGNWNDTEKISMLANFLCIVPICWSFSIYLKVKRGVRWRPYRVEYTGSLPTSEVKRRRARLVLGWGTAREDLRVLSAFLSHLVSYRQLLS